MAIAAPAPRAAADGRQRHHRGDFRREIKSGERAEHEDVAVREIDEPQNAINHRVAERDERENRAERQTVDELL
jgi:hypothetical protein